MQIFIARWWRSAVVAAIFLAIGGYLYLGQNKSLGATLTIVPSDFREQVRVSGTVVAAQDVALGFAASGRIAHTYATVGQHVAAGAILAENENGDVVASLLQKQSALSQAEANLSSLLAGTRPEEIAVAETAVTSAEAALVDAIDSAYSVADDAVHNKVDSFFTNPRTDPKLTFSLPNSALKTTVERDRAALEPIFTSWSALLPSITLTNAADYATQVQSYVDTVATLLADANAALNQAVADPTISTATLASYASTVAIGRTNINSATATLTADVAALETAQNTLALKQAGPTQDNISAQEAVVAAAQADVENAQAALTKTRVVAPFSGTVTRMDAKVGEIVSPSTSEIGMQSDGIFEIDTYVPEVAIARVKVGNPATTTLDAYGSTVTFPSTVVAVDPAETVKDGVPTYKTTLVFLNVDPRIRSGMTADVTIETGVLPHAIVIPIGAIRVSGGVSMVSVVDHNTATSRVITTGPSPMLGQAYVLSGLSAGDVVLLTPAP